MDFKFKINERVFLKDKDRVHFDFNAYIVGHVALMGKRFYLLDFEFNDVIDDNDIIKTIAYPESFLLSVGETKEYYFAKQNEIKDSFEKIFNKEYKPKKIRFSK